MPFRFCFCLLLPLMLLANLWLAGETAAKASASDMRIVIHVPARTLWLYSGDTIVQSYPVGVGTVEFPTPEGHYQVLSKVTNPGWENPFQPPGRSRIKPGKKSPLGTRWIGFLEADGGEFGIHGTPAPDSVGKFSSHGCVRMLIRDAEDLFDRVAVGTPVEIRYDPAIFDVENGELRLQVYPDWFGKGLPTAGELLQSILQQFPAANVNPEQLSDVLAQAKGQSSPIGRIGPVLDSESATLTFRLRIAN